MTLNDPEREPVDIIAEESDRERLRLLVFHVRELLDAGDRQSLIQTFKDSHESDLAEVLYDLTSQERVQLIRALGDNFSFTVLTEVDTAIFLDIFSQLSPEDIASGLRPLDSDDAVYLIEDLDEHIQMAVLSLLPAFNRLALERTLEFPERSAGRRMQRNFVAVPPYWSVGQTIDYMRNADNLPDDFFEVYIVDPHFHYVGSLALGTILRSKRDVRIQDLVNTNNYSVIATDNQEDVARLFERYNLISAPVCDEHSVLIGVITHDDIVDVIQEEAQEDMRLLSGVGDEEISDSVLVTAKSRIIWLLVNLGTAIFASFFITFFENPIQHKVELAILMGIVASMGGNAATQTMTVAVRGIATRELVGQRAYNAFIRELLVGLVNGAVLALVCALITYGWFDDWELGFVIGLALFVNHMIAGIAGILIPLALEKLSIDPAVASGVFVTTVTDVVGFCFFLFIAAWWFNLW